MISALSLALRAAELELTKSMRSDAGIYDGLEYW